MERKKSTQEKLDTLLQSETMHDILHELSLRVKNEHDALALYNIAKKTVN